ncbi:hydroxyisourate hydrolase [Streptomyces griseocarneus]|uniref:hydroxyisourate hydrolase n=1 Tax=Streptomyces griseocarneus TaxID=51201 RepID=UPI00167ECA13|nr:hydroxyisourate hydrolase [Streptomyces griseocarneus]MBZ6472684.1 hydroxyisourate hydrolase [Streptomyces griseocarneus]GHG46717.1 5-hydroxyisourate hydrolase [Streptomyces griseocarneus]
MTDAATVSTHVLDTGTGHPAGGVDVELSVHDGAVGRWSVLAAGRTDADGRCAAFPPLSPRTDRVRLRFDVAAYRSGPVADGEGAGPAFFPEVAVTFAVAPGEHHHVPLLLSPFGYSVYRGS